MLQPRIEGERIGLAPAPLQAPLVYPVVPDDELETPPLPRDHPQWVKDALSVSQRARQLLSRLRPVVLRVLTFWDHAVRSIAVGGRRLNVDPSGSYRLD